MKTPRPTTSMPARMPPGRPLAAAYSLALVLAAGGVRAQTPPREASPAESSWVEAPRPTTPQTATPQATPQATAPKVETNVIAPKPAPPKVGAPKGETYSLIWTRLDGGELCIGQRDLARSVEEAHGQRVFVSASRADRSIEGRIGPRPGGGFRATLQAVDAKGVVMGTRALASDGPDCRELDETITLSVTLLIDPSASVEPDDFDAGPGAKTAAPARKAAPKPPGPQRDEWFEVSLAAGYVTGDRIFPHPSARSDSLGPGVGVRAGYAFRSGLWLGASYTYYRGGRVGIEAFEGDTHISSFGSTFQVHAPGAELGYRFALGPFEAKPYAGIGPAFFDFADGSTFIGGNDGSRHISPPGLASTSPRVALAVWPGVALRLPLSEKFFIGADGRWVMVAGAPAQNNVGLFGGVGVRL